jgi:hypothetical protein
MKRINNKTELSGFLRSLSDEMNENAKRGAERFTGKPIFGTLKGSTLTTYDKETKTTKSEEIR